MELQLGAEAEADERADRSDRSDWACVRVENESEWPKRTIRNILRNSIENASRENSQTFLHFSLFSLIPFLESISHDISK